MTSWLSFEIPDRLIGDERVSGNEYIKTYRTEILLPPDGEYAGYCFLHPTKLVSFRSPLASITYNETFSFELIKKEREPGKRYKRYSLTVAELLAIYEPEVLRLKAQIANKEKKRLAQIGDITALECRAHHQYYAKIVFQHGKRMYSGKGAEFRCRDEIRKSKVIATNVSRELFESVCPELDILCEEYRLIQDVRFAINRSVSPRSSDKTVSIFNSFYGLSDQWEEEFYKTAHLILENQKEREE